MRAVRREQRAREAVLRPVEVLLRDPLSEVARKERRSLLGISAIAILVGSTGLVPQKIENFGIDFGQPERLALLWVFMAVVLYYTGAFITYAMNDFLSYRHAVHVGRREIRRQLRANRDSDGDIVGSGRLQPESLADAGDLKPWSMIGFVSPVSLIRGVFDFGVPLFVAVYAIATLYGATFPPTPPKAPPAKEVPKPSSVPSPPRPGG